MKTLLFLIPVVLLSLQSFAENEAMVTAGPSIGGQFPHFGNQVAGGGVSSPAKVSLRLIGKTFTRFDGYNFIPVDSIFYAYSNDRGGVLNNDNINNDEPLMYDESVRYEYDAVLNLYNNKLRRTQEYYPDNRVKSLTYMPWKAITSTWRESERYVYTYDNQRMVASTHELPTGNGGWINQVTSELFYNGSNVTAMESPVYRVSFLYDQVTNNLVEMVDEVNTGVWEYKAKHLYEYAGKDVIKHTTLTYKNNTWVNDERWEYVYVAGKLESKSLLVWNGFTWVNSGKHILTYDANGNKLSDTRQIWNAGANSFDNVSREEWNYNIQNLPTDMTTRTWNGAAWEYTKTDIQYRFHYQNYFPSKVKNVASLKNLSIYPIPANDVVTVELNWDKAQKFDVSLYDIKGTVLRTWHEQPASSFRTTIMVNEYPSGTYFMRISGNTETINERIVINH